ncbi:MAG: hypothetical protein R3A52_21740 [Polyangiales bacterium]
MSAADGERAALMQTVVRESLDAHYDRAEREALATRCATSRWSSSPTASPSARSTR